MSDVHEDGHNGSRRGLGRKRKYEGYNTTKPPTEAELDEQTPEQRETASLWTPEQLEIETRTVRFDMTFRDVVKFRDQAEMIAACMAEIIKVSRQHDLGSPRQRINARREADSLRRSLARFNGKKPRTNTWQDR